MKRSVLFLLILTSSICAKAGNKAAPLLSEVSDFRHTMPVVSDYKQTADTTYFTTRGGLNNFYQAVTKQKKATVAFLGGSITFNPGWRDKVCAYLKAQYPETQFHFIAAGIPSLGSVPHAFRVQQDVLDSGKVDLLFFEAAVNDRVNGTPADVQYLSLEGVVRHALKSNPQMNIVMMSFAEPEKTADYVKGIVPGEVARHEEIAGHYNLPSINLAKEVADKVTNHVFSWEKDFKDIHPSPFGQELYYQRIKKLLAVTYAGYTANPKVINNKLPKPLHQNILDNGAYADVKLAGHGIGWWYDASWKPEDGKDTRPGFVNVPMLSSVTPQSKLTFPFNGDAVGIAIVSGPDAGMISYQIDNGPVQKMDLYTQWSGWLHLPWYLVLGHDLPKGKHTLTITLLTDKNPQSKGTACRIVHFLVNKG